jgi:hypothetical protein
VGRVLEVEWVGAVEHGRRVDIGETLLERLQPVEGDSAGHMDVGEVGLVDGLERVRHAESGERSRGRHSVTHSGSDAESAEKRCDDEHDGE